MDEDMEAYLNDSFSSDNFSFFLFEDFNSTFDNDFPVARLVAFIPFLLVCLVGLVGNALVVILILSSRRMWRTMNVFVFSLALGDFFYMLCLLVFAIEIMHSLGTFMCKLYWTLASLATFSSFYFLAIMSITVFLHTYYPSFSKNLNFTATAPTSFGIWILSLLLGIPFFLYAKVDDYSACLISWPASFWNIIFVSYRFGIAFLAPLILTSVFLILTQCRIRRLDQSSDPIVTEVKEDVVMIMVLSLVFIVFWLPTHLLEMVLGFTSNLHFSEGTYYIISIIPYLKSCIYPFIYGFLSRSFKDSYNRIFCCKKVPEGENPPKTSNNVPEDKSTVC
ncbi:somatostatin receptor type 5-like [Anomaloglossus baeobatrachus]|uniref:somatostatin receptor type 5-like n=1 Tax=Anomaloglossus baeobatrachus TaxID=238106 RepID=UPI003F505CA6